MKAVTPEQLQDIVDRLAEGLRPERVYLYGSHAGGTPHADSDIDILIVMPDTGATLAQLYGAAEKCLRGSELPTELVIYTHAEFERQKHWVSSLAYTISRKGQLLYAA
ncbi:MAG: nucleotidyltransferase domain-containing protein [Planctomycetes bacterium]|nr:nucleotidyltransferase domain-containing protein [Planctomycetota bacterium]